MDRACGTYGRQERCIQGLMGRPEGKRSLGRPRRRWEDTMKMDLSELGCGGVEWIDLGQDKDWWRAFLNAVMNPRVP